MAWQDRAYYRDSNRSRWGGNGNPFMWLLTGSVSVGTWFGVDVRIHASLIVLLALTLLFPGLIGFYHSFTFAIVLLASVLLHEFGHCFGSWSVGGRPTQIILTPLGGVALADAPRRPWATFWTVLCGPLVNLLLCVITGTLLVVLYHQTSVVPFNLLGGTALLQHVPLDTFGHYLWWIFAVNEGLFFFNMMWPAFPLDCGQIVQSLLWVRLGYYRSMNIACSIGIPVAIVMVMIGLVGSWLLAIIGLNCLLICIQMRAQLKAAGPWGFEDENNDYAAAMWNDSPSRSTPTRRGKHLSKRVLKRAQKEARDAELEQARIDAILAKVSAHGMHSLTWGEKRALHKATERQRMREEEPRRR